MKRKLEREELRRRLNGYDYEPKRGNQAVGSSGDVFLAYGLNKNLKKLKNRPNSVKPKKNKHIAFEEGF